MLAREMEFVSMSLDPDRLKNSYVRFDGKVEPNIVDYTKLTPKAIVKTVSRSRRQSEGVGY